MEVLMPGANKVLTNSKFTVALQKEGSIDVSVFLLKKNGKVPGDSGMIFYGAARSACGGVILEDSSIVFDLASLPTDIERIAVTATSDGPNFSQAKPFIFTTTDFVCRYETSGRQEAALILFELYLRNGVWKVRNVAQGFNGGLRPLAEHFGVEIEDDPSPSPSPSPSAPRSSINLSKISLTKESPAVNLQKSAGALGLIKVNLNWDAGKRGFFSRGIDLDLGACVEHSDGSRHLVQALGNSFSFAPYIKLLGDDRTGENAAGEWMEIDGNRIQELKKITIYTFIYEGAANWEKAKAYVTLYVPDMPPIETRLTEASARKGFCAIADLEVRAGKVEVKRINKYYSGHAQCDKDMGWGFRWRSASK